MYISACMDSLPYDLDIMSQILGMLHSLPNDEHNNDYKHIIEVVKSYLSKHCHHAICSDEIDVDVECCKTIKYCEKCYLTFD